MPSARKLLARILGGSRNVAFHDFVKLVEAFGFRLLRISGSHHVFGRAGVVELINLQDVGGQAKPYQINQFLHLVEKYNLQLEEKP
jgi:hypothetical protein